MIEFRHHMGTYKIKVRHNDGRIEEEIVHNKITDLALDALINVLDNIDPDLDIKYLAIGTDGTAVAGTDTTLGAEIFRTPVLTSNNTATGEFTTTFIILDSEAVDTWEEIGIFCGDSATASADTGNLLSRILYHREKTSSEEIEVTRVDKEV